MLMHPELQGGPQPVPSGDWNWRVNFHSTLAAPVFGKWLYKKAVCCSCLLSRKRRVWMRLCGCKLPQGLSQTRCAAVTDV